MLDLRAAIRSGQRVIEIPPGFHEVAESVVIDRPTLVRGFGDGISRLRFLNGSAIILAGNAIGLRDFRAESDAPVPVIQTPSGPGGGVQGLRFEGLRVVAPNCIRLTDVVDVDIRLCRIYPRGGVGLDVEGYGFATEGHPGEDDNNDAVHVADCRFGGSRHGDEILARLTGSAHVSFHMGRFNFGGVGLQLRPGLNQEPKFVQLLGCGFENHSAEAIEIEAGRMIRVFDLYASHDSEGRHSVVYFGRGFRGEAHIHGAQIRGGARDGLRAVSGDLISIVGGQIGNNGRKVTGDGLRVFPGVRKLVTRGVALEPFSDGNGALQRHAHKVEAGEWDRG